MSSSPGLQQCTDELLLQSIEGDGGPAGTQGCNDGHLCPLGPVPEVPMQDFPESFCRSLIFRGGWQLKAFPSLFLS